MCTREKRFSVAKAIAEKVKSSKPLGASNHPGKGGKILQGPKGEEITLHQLSERVRLSARSVARDLIKGNEVKSMGAKSGVTESGALTLAPPPQIALIMAYAHIASQAPTARCMGQACMAAMEIYRQNIPCATMTVDMDAEASDKHVFVIVGKSADIIEPDKWSEDIVICDTWITEHPDCTDQAGVYYGPAYLEQLNNAQFETTGNLHSRLLG